MTLTGVMAVILRYFSEFGYLPGVLRKTSVFTFAISSADEFLLRDTAIYRAYCYYKLS